MLKGNLRKSRLAGYVLVVGGIVMLVAGVRSDLKVRKVLRARLAQEDREERERSIDTSQQDLFPSESD